MKAHFLKNLLVILLAAVVMDGLLQYQMQQRHRQEQITDISLRLAAIRARIEKEITANLLLIQGTANYIALHPSLSEEDFNRFARETMEGEHLLRNLGVAPDYVVTYVYPFVGNQDILGADYRELPGQWEQARRAQETGKLVVAGPLELMQGGVGLIGRAPVFVQLNHSETFWGLVSAVIDAGKLYERVGLTRLEGLRVAIRGKDGKGAQGDVFFGDKELFAPDGNAVLMPVVFPGGQWQMAALPIGGWTLMSPTAWQVHGLVLLLFLTAVVVVYKSARRSSELVTTKESLNEAQALAHLGNWDLDLKQGRLWWSEEIYRIFGVDMQTFAPSLEAFFSLVHPEDKEEVDRAFKEALADRSVYSIEHRIVRPDGALRHVLERGKSKYAADGKAVRSTGTVLDITERKQAEEALRAEESKLRAMSEASYDAVIMIDTQDVVHFWSPAAERMFGWTGQEALGNSMHALIVPERYRADARQGLDRFAVTGRGPVLDSVMEFEALHKNGHTFPVERSVSAFQSDGHYFAVGTLRDITQRKKDQQELQSFAERIALASEAGSLGIWEWNVHSDELTWDARMHELYAVRPDEFSGLYEAWKSRVHPEDIEEAEKGLEQARQKAGDWHTEFRVLLPSGNIRYIQASARAHSDSQGRVERIIGINRDITQRKKAQLALYHLATTDSLTGINNRSRFMELTSQELERCLRYSRTFSAILFDADKFKLVNDTWGHDVGDLVLKQIARTARETLRTVDILGRIGGEEFAVALPETPLDSAVEAAERLRAAIAAQSVTTAEGEIVRFTVSLGVTALEEPDGSDVTVDILLQRADRALYKAKEHGRNRVDVWRKGDASS